VQPEGPYLLGGHSYGGAVAMEVAMVLESWGREIGAVLVRLSCTDAYMHACMWACMLMMNVICSRL